MAFMKKQITSKQKWYRIETSYGNTDVPFDVICAHPENTEDFQDYAEGAVQSWEVIEGYGARMSAPGYIDCTEWAVFDTVEEAEQYLEEMYGDDDETEDEDAQ